MRGFVLLAALGTSPPIRNSSFFKINGDYIHTHYEFNNGQFKNDALNSQSMKIGEMYGVKTCQRVTFFMWACIRNACVEVLLL
jgi:hypothetical protein